MAECRVCGRFWLHDMADEQVADDICPNCDLPCCWWCAREMPAVANEAPYCSSTCEAAAERDNEASA